MAKPLNPNASPYIHNHPPPHFYVYVHPNPYNPHVLHPPFCTYNTQLQPTPRKPFPTLPSGPRIPKPGLSWQMKWIPKIPQVKASSNVAENVRFRGRRWKNGRRMYQTVLPMEADTTSVMIKNIPNKYTRELLIQTLDNHCQAENNKIYHGEEGCVSAYDFVYLPIDFKRRTNAGFAFVNFTNSEAAFRFRNAFNGKRWNLFDSSKVAEITRARIQGKKALIDNCKGMDFTYGSEEDMAVWFAPARDGSGEVRSRMFMWGKSSWVKMKSWN